MFHQVAAKDPDNLRETNAWQIVPHSSRKGKSKKKMREDCNLPVITVEQYASRNAMMMSLTVSWSPIFGSSGDDHAIPRNSSNCCSILAVGGKCGRISLWRIYTPEYYSIDNTRYSNKVSLVGLLKAHDTWITAIDWALYDSKISKAQFVLATGSSDSR